MELYSWLIMPQRGVRLACQEDGAPPGVETLTKLSTALSGVWYQVTCTARLTTCQLDIELLQQIGGHHLHFITHLPVPVHGIGSMVSGQVARALQGSSYCQAGLG